VIFEDAERVRIRVRQALGVGEPDPGLRSRVMNSLPVEIRGSQRRWQAAAGGLAVLLAVAAVAGLIYVRQRSYDQPASNGRVVGALKMTADLGFRCSLPVVGYSTEARVSIPDGGVTADKTFNQQGKGGPGGPGYVAGRWLQVTAAWASPNGHSFAYQTTTTGVPGQPQTSAIYVRDVASNQSRQVWSGDGSVLLLRWTTAGIYYTRQTNSEVGSYVSELWVVDPARGGSAHRVGPNPPLSQDQIRSGRSVNLFLIGGGAAWGVSSSRPIGPTSSFTMDIERMDLRDGSVSTWFSGPVNSSVGLIGMDAQGRPVLTLSPRSAGNTPPVKSQPPPQSVVLLTGPNQTTVIADGTDPTFHPGQALGDGHGVWFSVAGSLWLYTTDRGLAKVAEIPQEIFPAPPAPSGKGGGVAVGSPPPSNVSGVSLSLAGPCS
jgi:hypothetical protein